MERTIKVTGKRKISVKPDTIRIIITQSAVQIKYERAIKESSEKKEYLNTKFQTLGFAKHDLKTLHYDVDTEYESYQDYDRSWKKRFMGYRYTHTMKLEFPADNEKLGEVLGVLSHCPGEPEFSIQYTISDPESAKNELLAKAVEDSMTKAKVLCESAGVLLGDILSIDYSWGEIDFVTRPVDRFANRCYDAMPTSERAIPIDIEPDDIDVTDTVTVIWGIN